MHARTDLHRRLEGRQFPLARPQRLLSPPPLLFKRPRELHYVRVRGCSARALRRLQLQLEGTCPGDEEKKKTEAV